MVACFTIDLDRGRVGTGGTAEKLGHEVTVFLMRRTPGVERAGAGKWFVDLEGCGRLLRNDFAGWGGQMAGLLREYFGVDVQIGIAANKVTAELACRLARPGAVVWLLPGQDRELLGGVLLERLPLTEKQLQVFRDRRIRWSWEVRDLGEDCLRMWFGSREGSAVWRVIHGACDEPVKPYRIPRILKKTFVFSHETACQQDVVRAGVYLSGALYHETRKLGGILRKFSCRLVYVDDLETLREVHVAGFQQEEEYAAAVARMLESMPLRRVQMKAVHLQCPVEFEPTEQQDLFSERERMKRRDLDRALKDVREKYGVEALHRASGTARRRSRAGERWP